ncbi:MAG: MFS transporter [candidate division KSB1 bacterium]|nr:MFS transporter [candidate division KSB1 bacterium]MDZ7368422.1 MFS transporter [candidate division KSB1 bacterium]MDZ7406002.1 MFS transporter [candidate division KSB1 bacterium]
MMVAQRRLWLFGLLLGILLLGLADVQIISPILPKLAEDFSVSPALMGTAVSAYAIAAALWALVVGPLSDQIGRLIFLRAAAWALAGAASAAYFAGYFEHYVAARVLAGLAGGTISACVIAQVADLFDYSARGRAMGWVGAIYFIAAVIAVPLGAWITAAWSWRLLYLLQIALAFILGLLVQPSWSPAASQKDERDHSVKKVLRQQLQNYPRYLAQKATRMGLLLAITVSAAVAGLVTYLGVWLTTAFGMSIATIGVVFMITGVASVIGALGGGWMADHLGKRRMMALSSLLLAAILLAVSAVQTRTSVFLFCAAGGLAMALREGPFQALISELVPANERGAYIALRNGISQLAIAVAVALGVILFERFGFHAVAYFAAACSLAASGLALLMAEPQAAPIADETIAELPQQEPT